MSSSGFSKSTFLLKDGVSAFCGTNIIVSDLAFSKETKQVRFPRSKRKRIRRKWEKDRRNWVNTSKCRIWQLSDGTLVMDPVSYAELQESLRKAPPVQEPLPPSFTMEGFLEDLRSLYRPARGPSLFDLGRPGITNFDRRF